MQTRRQHGQSIVEFALVMPIFLVLMFGLIDFSRLLFSYVSLASSTREFARMAAISSSTNANAAVNAFNNYTLIASGFSPATTVRVQPTSGGVATCSSITSSGCELTVLGSVTSGTLTLQLTPGTPNASGAITTTMPESSWNPRALFTASNTGDFIVITVLDRLYDGKVKICPLPLSTACVLPNRAASTDGVLQVDTYYTFVFSPLFQNRLTGVVDAYLMRPLAAVSTSARTYIE